MRFVNLSIKARQNAIVVVLDYFEGNPKEAREYIAEHIDNDIRDLDFSFNEDGSLIC